MTDCIFCKIAHHEIPSNIVYEDDKIIAFHDITPAADVHILIIPKVHIETALDVSEGEGEIFSYMIQKAKNIALDQGLLGYKWHMNVGKDGGQVVMHMHLHLLGGEMKLAVL